VALGVPAIARLEQSALLLLLVAVIFIALIALFLVRRTENEQGLLPVGHESIRGAMIGIHGSLAPNIANSWRQMLTDKV